MATAINYDELVAINTDFGFDFASLHREGYIIYKLCSASVPGIAQGLVAFRPTPGALDCANMEVAAANKRGNPLFGGIGRAMVALCCQFSFDKGMDGYIFFTAKGRLEAYYRRFGAKHLTSGRMCIDTDAALRLTSAYF